MFETLGRILRNGTFVFLGATAALYIGLGWLSYYLLVEFVEVERENLSLLTGSALRGGLLKHDAGMRGYALSGADHYLLRQRQGETELNTQLSVLASLNAEPPARRKKLQELRRLVDSAVTIGTRLIETRRSGPLPEDELEETLLAALDNSEAISEMVSEISAEEVRRQANRAHRRIDLLRLFWGAMVCAGLMLLFAAARFWGRSLTLIQAGISTEAQVSDLAHRDALTGLPNRRALDRRVDAALERAAPGRFNCALFMLDLDGFKEVNDKFGHHAGDALLKIVGARLRQTVRTRELVSRLGGDEFVIFVEHASDGQEVIDLGQRLVEALAEPAKVGKESLTISVSIGVCIRHEKANSLDALMRCADHALYEAKRSGKNRLVVYKGDGVPDSASDVVNSPA